MNWIYILTRILKLNISLLLKPFSGFGRKEDLPTYVKLQRALATVGHADAIVLVISSATPRTQDLDPLLAAFDLLAQNFDVNVIDNTALIFTRWRYDQSRNSHLADGK